MKRLIEKKLTSWKNIKKRNVLLLRGARQVGKTYSIRELGKQFDHFLEINLEKESAIHAFFENTLDPKVINEKLFAYYNIPIVSEKTLLFFDEIQACPNAIRALRFYNEEMPELHVVAAGSLLEFALSEIPSFGVGRITSLFMYPMCFSEFLEANGNGRYNEILLNHDFAKPIDVPFHQFLLEQYRLYQVLGGMPAVLDSFVNERNIHLCQNKINSLQVSLQDDFAKYKKRVSIITLRETFYSVVHQMGKKFKYTNISREEPIYKYKEALEMLVLAGLAHKVYHTSASGIPLDALANHKKFKVLLFDLGLYQQILGVDLQEHITQTPIHYVHKGHLSELCVGLEIITHTSMTSPSKLFYWHRESPGSNAEIDFVIQKGQKIIPIEVKAGTKGQMQSLNLFLKEHHLPLGIRISHENFGLYDNIHVLPVYAIESFCNMANTEF